MSKDTKDKTLIAKLNQRKTAVCIFLILTYAVSCVVPFLFWGSNGDMLEKIYYVSQIISGFFVIAGVVIALLQYMGNNEEIEKQRKRQSAIKAAELADEYCDEIISYSDAMAELYSCEELKEILSRIEKKELTAFNVEEMKEKFGENFFNTWIMLIIGQYMVIHNLRVDKDGFKQAKNEVFKLVVNFSNRLESMCIKLNTGIADESTVYQSLHKNFIMNVHMLYMYMANCNKNEYDRTYSNVRDMYKKWNKINQEWKRKEEEDTAKFMQEQKRKREEFGERFIRR